MKTRPLNQRLGFRNGIARGRGRTLGYGHIAPGLAALLLVWPWVPKGALAAQGPAGTLVSWGQIVIPEVAPGTRFKAIAAGSDFSLALTEDGTVVACGLNDSDQATVPMGLSGVVAIAAQHDQSLALKADGTVVSLGGLFGESIFSSATAIAVGYNHALAIEKDTTVVASGSNQNQTGAYSGQATAPYGLSNVTAIAAGAYHSLALKEDGTVVAWGDNTYGQAPGYVGLNGVIGIAAAENISAAIGQDGQEYVWGDYQQSQYAWVPGGVTNIVSLAFGSSGWQCLALTQDGTVVGGGANPAIPGGLTNAVAIAAGDSHSLALLGDGTVVGWGDNTDDERTLAPQTSVTQVIAVAGADYLTLALKQDGTVLEWGADYAGQNTLPPAVAAGGVVAVAAARGHGLALMQDGTVVAWGDNSDGQSTVPSGLSGVSAIAAGDYYSLALTRDGRVVAWGSAPTVPPGLSGIIGIAAGGNHCLGLKQDGSVVAWGYNGQGQATVPSGLSGVIAIAAGGAHSMALLQNGTAVTWGDDSYGQSPGLIRGSGGRVTAIAAGDWHSLALMQDGTVLGWGSGGSERGEPEAVPPGLSGVTAIAAGGNRSWALIPSMEYPAPLAPTIVAPPQSIAASLGSAVGLYVVAEAGTALSYQWFFNGTNALSGATNSVLDIYNVQLSQAGAYGVVVTNAFGAVTSVPAVLSVVAPPVLAIVPTNSTASPGATVDFTVDALGSGPLAYQWFFNATNALGGATNAVLELANVQPEQSGAYSVVVSNLGGAVTSPPGVLTVVATPMLLTPPTNCTALIGTTVEFAVSAAGAAPLSYQWFFNGTNALTGGTGALLDLTHVQLSGAGAYTVVVANPFGAVTSSPAVLTVLAPVVAESTEAALRAALAGGGTVLFACDGTINLASQIAITNPTVLDATGHQVTIAPMNSGPYGATNRAFYVSSNVTFAAVNLAISNGCANALGASDPSTVRGGAILNDGVLSLRGVSFLNNSALYGGGAIANRAGGTVNAANCAFAGNSGGGPWPSYASPAYGGAILNEGGPISLQDCLFDGNSAQGGSDFDLGNGGGAALGGAIHNEGNLSVTGCTFRENSASGGGGFTWVPADGLGPGVWGTPGGGAFGGAICNLGAMALSGSTIMSNSAAGGGGGSGSSGGVGFNYVPIPSGAGGDGGSGFGGGLFNGGTASAVNCTFYANVGAGGDGGQGGPAWTQLYQIDEQGRWYQAEGPAASDGVDGSAVGCLCSTNGPLSLTNCTLAFNTASGEANGGPVVGGISATQGFMVNTLLATNSPWSCASGGVLDGGHNLDSDASCAFTAPTSLSNTDPLLGPLADNGGPTLTPALLPGSPAIGAADRASAPSTDQRGFPRPSGSADIGAFQFNLPFLLKAAPSAGGGLDLSVFGTPNRLCQLLASPDLVNWTAIATNSFGSLGSFLFHDPAGAGQTQKFYRAVMP